MLLFEDHDKTKADFDTNFRRMQRVIVCGWIVGAGVSIGLLGFGIWVIVRLLAHFGVI